MVISRSSEASREECQAAGSGPKAVSSLKKSEPKAGDRGPWEGMGAGEAREPRCLGCGTADPGVGWR